MGIRNMVMLGEKESFIIRVLMKKAQGIGCDCAYVPMKVDSINKSMAPSALITMYIEDDSLPQKETLHFLIDTMEEKELQMILIGSAREVEEVSGRIPCGLIYRTFVRPVDNEEYIASVTEYFNKAEEGEFRKSIMIVDDDPSFLALVREWLKEEYKVSMANSGLQAIKMLGKKKVDLILLDYEMPITTGPQVLEMLRNDPDTSSIPVMFLTSKGDKESVMSVVALRPEGYFLKSIQKKELTEKLHEYFIFHK